MVHRGKSKQKAKKVPFHNVYIAAGYLIIPATIKYAAKINDYCLV